MNTFTSYEEKPPDNAMLVITFTHYQDGHIEMKIIKSGEFSSPGVVASSPEAIDDIVDIPVPLVEGKDYPAPELYFGLPEPEPFDPNKCTEEISTIDILCAIRSKEFKDYLIHSLIPEFCLRPPSSSKFKTSGWQGTP